MYANEPEVASKKEYLNLSLLIRKNFTKEFSEKDRMFPISFQVIQKLCVCMCVCVCVCLYMSVCVHVYACGERDREG